MLPVRKSKALTLFILVRIDKCDKVLQRTRRLCSYVPRSATVRKLTDGINRILSVDHSRRETSDPDLLSIRILHCIDENRVTVN